MKAVLVALNAKYIHSNLGVYCLYAYSRKKGISSDELVYREFTINQEMDDILGALYKEKPDLIGFSCYIWNIEEIKEMARELHKILPDTAIWFGGPEVSYDAGKVLEQNPYLSGVFVGEGEESFYEVLRYYQKEEANQVLLPQKEEWAKKEQTEQTGQEKRIQKEQTEQTNDQKNGNAQKNDSIKTLEQIEGIAYRKQSGKEDTEAQKFIKSSDNASEKTEIIITKARPCMSLDDVVFPYHDMKDLKNRIVYYETSRGCPYGCSYCLSSVEKNVRFRSMELVKKELQFFLDQKVPQVKFVDRTFNCNEKHTMEIWQYIKEHDNGITNFHFELSADILTKKEIEYVRTFRDGLVQFEIGVQSTNPDTIQAIHRKMDLDRLKENVAMVHQERNIHQHLDLIAGLPYEDLQSFHRSFNDVYAMQPDQLQLGFLKVLKGSPMHRMAKEYGIQYHSKPPYEVLSTTWLPYEDVRTLKGIEEVVERYYNSLQFESSLRYLVEQEQDAFAFFEKLALFFTQSGYFNVKQSRMQNYEILYAFAKKEQRNVDIVKELLIYDLYARENVKKEPDFLENRMLTEEKKEKLRAFYQSEAQREKYLPDYPDYNWKQVMRMTHMEWFSYDIVQYLQDGILYEKKTLVLFDYQKRNPLSYQAKVQIVRE